jgi:hypothetical protein
MEKSFKEPKNKKMIIDYENAKKEGDEPIEEIQIDMIKAKKQFRLEINGIEIYFPYKPYHCQMSYMQKGKNYL